MAALFDPVKRQREKQPFGNATYAIGNKIIAILDKRNRVKAR
jgi:hypothetical protein